MRIISLDRFRAKLTCIWSWSFAATSSGLYIGFCFGCVMRVVEIVLRRSGEVRDLYGRWESPRDELGVGVVCMLEMCRLGEGAWEG